MGRAARRTSVAPDVRGDLLGEQHHMDVGNDAGEEKSEREIGREREPMSEMGRENERESLCLK